MGHLDLLHVRSALCVCGGGGGGCYLLLDCFVFNPFCFPYLGRESHLSNSILNFYSLLTALE